MAPQNYEKINAEIHAKFAQLKKQHPERLETHLNLSWSNWGFGMEALATSAQRLAKSGIEYIELHGNHYGPDLGYKDVDVLKDHNISVAGICGMFSAESDLSSNSGVTRQNALDYIRREIDFAVSVGAGYLLVVPGAVGRPQAYDNSEFDRSAATLRLVVDLFAQHSIKPAIEPIRSAEVSFCHTIADAKRYIDAVDHPGVRHINGDIYHMQSEESHIANALLGAGEQLINLHIADTNRCALGEGSLDLDTIIEALYLIDYNRPGCYVTPEPLGPGGDPYPAMHGTPQPELLDALVSQTATYFRQREQAVLAD